MTWKKTVFIATAELNGTTQNHRPNYTAVSRAASRRWQSGRDKRQVTWVREHGSATLHQAQTADHLTKFPHKLTECSEFFRRLIETNTTLRWAQWVCSRREHRRVSVADELSAVGELKISEVCEIREHVGSDWRESITTVLCITARVWFLVVFCISNAWI